MVSGPAARAVEDDDGCLEVIWGYTWGEPKQARARSSNKVEGLRKRRE
jgi:hypothetical protein